MISTHAPTRGATNEWDYFFPNVYISTHAPTRGATAGQSGVAKSGNYFNPRSHEGSDDDVFNLSNSSVVFQPTLPRGERHNLLNITMSFIYFNPRSHEGSDLLAKFSATTVDIFQPTLPRGERPPGNPRTLPFPDFNPRSHEGSDSKIAHFFFICPKAIQQFHQINQTIFSSNTVFSTRNHFINMILGANLPA